MKHSPPNGTPLHSRSKDHSGNGNGHSSAPDGTRRNPHADNGTLVSVDGGVSTSQQARQMTDLLMTVMRDLFAVDDQAAELPLRQLRVCAMLYERSRSMTSLSRELQVSLPAMTQIADRLEKARLVKRSFEGPDRRVRSLQLTPRARRLMQNREDSRIQRAASALEQLAPHQRENVLSTLQALQSASAPCAKKCTSSLPPVSSADRPASVSVNGHAGFINHQSRAPSHPESR